jgi:hypothetical protein
MKLAIAGSVLCILGLTLGHASAASNEQTDSVDIIECQESNTVPSEYVMLSKLDTGGTFLYVTGVNQKMSLISSELAHKLKIDWSADSFSIETLASPDCTLLNQDSTLGIYKLECAIPQGSKLVVRTGSRTVRKDLNGGGYYTLAYNSYYGATAQLELGLQTSDNNTAFIKSPLKNPICSVAP